MQHPPNINMVWSLNVKHQMRIARQRPRLQAWQIQFVGIVWGTRSCVAADVGKCAFQLINEANGRNGGVNLLIVVDGLFNILMGHMTRNHWFGVHALLRVLLALSTRSRSPTK